MKARRVVCLVPPLVGFRAAPPRTKSAVTDEKPWKDNETAVEHPASLACGRAREQLLIEAQSSIRSSSFSIRVAAGSTIKAQARGQLPIMT